MERYETRLTGSSDPVEGSETESGTEGGDFRETSLTENSRRVVGDDVDTTELLHEHDDTGCEGSTTVTRDGEEFDDSEATGSDVGLLLEKSVNHEEITSGLKLGVTETAE